MPSVFSRLDEAFKDYFDELTFEFDKRVNIKDLIDRVEDFDTFSRSVMSAGEPLLR